MLKKIILLVIIGAIGWYVYNNMKSEVDQAIDATEEVVEEVVEDVELMSKPQANTRTQ